MRLNNNKIMNIKGFANFNSVRTSPDVNGIRLGTKLKDQEVFRTGLETDETKWQTRKSRNGYDLFLVGVTIGDKEVQEMFSLDQAEELKADTPYTAFVSRNQGVNRLQGIEEVEE